VAEQDSTSRAEEPSEEQLEPQVPEETQGTTGQEPSSDSPPVQEQDVLELDETKLEKLLETNPLVKARIYREAQSMKDRELHQERLRREREEEEARIREMSDAEFGSYMREKQSLAAAAQAKALEMAKTAVSQALSAVQEEGLSLLGPEARKKVEAELPTYKTFADFVKGLAKAKADSEATKMVASERKQLEKTIRNQLQAEYAKQLAPDIGRGTPASRLDNVHGIDAIAAGIGEKLREANTKK